MYHNFFRCFKRSVDPACLNKHLLSQNILYSSKCFGRNAAKFIVNINANQIAESNSSADKGSKSPAV